MAVAKGFRKGVDLCHTLLCMQKLLDKMQPLFISFQRLRTPPDQIVHALPADAFLLGDLPKGQIVKDHILVDSALAFL